MRTSTSWRWSKAHVLVAVVLVLIGMWIFLPGAIHDYTDKTLDALRRWAQ